MDKLSLQTNIVKAIIAIDDKTVDPIIDTGEFLYYFDTSDKERAIIIYTRFTRDGQQALDTTRARYGSYHVLNQILHNPVPKSVEPPIIDSLPESITTQSMIDPTIILGFY